jgi:hypothetical protein
MGIINPPWFLSEDEARQSPPTDATVSADKLEREMMTELEAEDWGRRGAHDAANQKEMHPRSLY